MFTHLVLLQQAAFQPGQRACEQGRARRRPRPPIGAGEAVDIAMQPGKALAQYALLHPQQVDGEGLARHDQLVRMPLPLHAGQHRRRAQADAAEGADCEPRALVIRRRCQDTDAARPGGQRALIGALVDLRADCHLRTSTSASAFLVMRGTTASAAG